MKKYQIIYADPPWNYTVFDSKHGGRGTNQYYKTMRAVDIFDLPVPLLADENCALFLWATSAMLPEALYTIKAWGFTYKTIAFSWIKQNKKSAGYFFGMGSWTRQNTELVLLGMKGKMKRLDASISQILTVPLQEHSQKPNEAREGIVTLLGDLPRIELFARQKVEGWDCWGNEVDSDIDLATVKEVK